MVRAVTHPWPLEIAQASGDPWRKVAGLPLALRLALAAPAAGAPHLAVPNSTELAHHKFSDPRLKIPVVGVPPPDQPTVVASASLVIHREHLRASARAATSEAPLIIIAGDSTDGIPFGHPAVNVGSAKDVAEAESVLFRALRKPQDGWTSTYLNRYISLFLSRFLVKTPLLPNQVSFGILFIGLAGGYFAYQGDYVSLVIGAVLFQTQSVLDGCDGEMSRMTYRGSLAGEWLDTVGDDITNYIFFAGAASGLYSTTGNVIYAWAGAVTVFCGGMASGIEYRYLIKIGSGDLLKYPLSQSTNEGSGPLAAIQPLFKRDTFVFLTLIATVLGQVGPMLLVFAVSAAGVLLTVIATEVRMARDARTTT